MKRHAALEICWSAEPILIEEDDEKERERKRDKKVGVWALI